MSIEKIWYSSSPVRFLLLPLSWIYAAVISLRRLSYRLGLLYAYRLPVPVLVIGNITVGGTGKTPLTLWMIDFLRRQGYRPGVISRGYGGKSRVWPLLVTPESDPELVGDEPVLLVRRARCPMAVGPDRIASAELLLNETDCDIIISDDGMQHYRLERDLEIAVIDGVRRMGNGCLLPAGPLREPVSRLSQTDLVVVNGGKPNRGEFPMQLNGHRLMNITDSGWVKELDELVGQQVHAVAGIGNPKRFFDYLRQAGLKPIEHPLPDHHVFTAKDLQFDDYLPVLMTEKDAVKCSAFANERLWVLPVTASLDEIFERRLISLINKRMQDG